MDIFFTILRFALSGLGILISVIYTLSQCWKKIPTPKINFALLDGVVYVVVSLICGLGFNSSWGLLAFLPLVAIKYLCHWLIQKKRVRGSGRWVEVEWKLYANLEQQAFKNNPAMYKEISRIPKQTHILIPRFAYLVGLKVLEKQLTKNKATVPQQFSKNPMFLKMQTDIDVFIKKSKNLPVGSSQELSFQTFATLKVARL